MSKVLSVLVAKLAEGDFGAWPKAAYWWLAGRKTWMGLLFGAAWALLEYGNTSGACAMNGWDCAGWASALGSVAAFLLAIGLYDGAIRTLPPRSPAAEPYRRPFGGPGQLGFASRLTLALLAVVSLLLLSGCATGQVRLGRDPRPLAPDPEVVEQLACRGEIAEAERYVELRSGSMADRIELIERARKAVAKRPGCCAAEGKCGPERPLIITQ